MALDTILLQLFGLWYYVDKLILPSQFMYKGRMARKSLIIVVAVVVTALVAFGPALSARASLLPRVNDALTAGGFALTFENWQPFAAGVVTGHYKTFEQLAGAAKFHKQRGTLPDESKFSKTVAAAAGKVTATSPGKTACLNGEALSLSTKNITVKYAVKGKVINKAFSLTKKQYDAAVGRSIRKGSSVKVCFQGNKVAGNLINLAPKGQEETFGNVDGGGGGGSSSSSSSGS